MIHRPQKVSQTAGVAEYAHPTPYGECGRMWASAPTGANAQPQLSNVFKWQFENSTILHSQFSIFNSPPPGFLPPAVNDRNRIRAPEEYLEGLEDW